MDQNTKDITNLGRNMEREAMFGVMAQNMLESGLKIKLTDMYKNIGIF